MAAAKRKSGRNTLWEQRIVSKIHGRRVLRQPGWPAAFADGQPADSAGLRRGQHAAPAGPQPARRILRGHRVAEVVAPRAVDVQAPAAQSLLAEPELLHDPAA